jgi:hypothetical protein
MSTTRPKLRPTTNGRAKRVVFLRVVMPGELHRWLKSTAAAEGMTVTAFVNALLRETKDRVREAAS